MTAKRDDERPPWRPGDRVSDEVLEAALEGLELAELEARFPERSAEVRAGLQAAGAYFDSLERSRAGRGEETLPPGTRLGEYRIVDLLGRGAMGVVYRARQETLDDREVALKVLPPDLVARDPRFLLRFRREASRASDLHIPNVAEVHGYGESGGYAYFAMRLIPGPSLSDVIENLAERRRTGHFDPAGRSFVRRAVEVVRDVARALQVLHEHGLVHRDVKSGNILLDRGEPDRLVGEATLIDFGLVRPVAESDLTGSLTLLGTPAYAAPEVRLGNGVDQRADVFSLAVVLHDLLSLRRSAERATASAGLEDIRSTNPGVDESLAAVLGLALEKEPGLRYADCGAFAAELDRWLRGEAVQALPTSPAGRARAWARRNRAKAAGVLGAGLVLLVLLASLLTVSLWSAGTIYAEAARMEAAREGGDLLSALDSSQVLLENTRLASLLPAMSDDVERARGFRESGLGRTARAIQAPGRGGIDALYDELLRHVFSHDGDRDAALSFLHAELEAPTLSRRVSAARTLANWFLVEPVPLLDDNGEVFHPPPLLRDLEGRLVNTLRSRTPRADPILRQWTAAALSGMSWDAAFCLTSALDDDDPSTLRVVYHGLSIIWDRLRVSVLESNAGDFRIALPFLDVIAMSLWKMAHEEVRARSGGDRDLSGSHLDWAHSGLLNLVWVYREIEKSGGRKDWSSLSPDLQGFLRLHARAIDELEEESAFGSQRLPAPLFLRDAWELLSRPEKEAWTGPWGGNCVSSLHQLRKSSLPVPFTTYHNQWIDRPLSSPRRWSSDPETERTFAELRFSEEGIPLLDGWLAEFALSEGELESGHVLLGAPGQSRLTASIAMVPGVKHARLTLVHEVPHRAILPGGSTARVRLECDTQALGADLQLEAGKSAYEVTFQVDPSERMNLTLTYLGTEGVYWLYRLRVTFLDTPGLLKRD